MNLTERPGSLAPEDRIWMKARFSRPVHSYLFWAYPDGEVHRIWPPAGFPPGPSPDLDYPPKDRGEVDRIDATSRGTDLNVLIASDEPATEDQILPTIAAIQQATPGLVLAEGMVYRDGIPVGENDRGGPHLVNEPRYSGPTPAKLFTLEQKLRELWPHATVSTLVLSRTRKPNTPPAPTSGPE